MRFLSRINIFISSTAKKKEGFILYSFKLIIVLTLLASDYSQAQDIHFSQYDLSPINLNPAMTGKFVGDYRFISNYRTQWASVSVPYNTFSLGGDFKNLLSNKKISGGIQINHDKAGDSHFKTLQINVSGAYSFAINNDSTQNLSIGMQTGFTNKKIAYDPLFFDAQYDGYSYNANLPTQENFNRFTKTYLNLNFGGAYSKHFDKRKDITAGLALFNISKPQISFNNESASKLNRRIVFHSNAEWIVGNKFNVLPSLLYMRQGKFSEFNFGGSIKYILTDFIGIYRTVWFGLFYRNKDAGFLTMGMDYDNFKVGVSYDINTSSLVPASRKRGSFEFAIIYIVNKTPFKRVQHRVCPNYI